MPKGRQRRLKNFQQRAEAFGKDWLHLESKPKTSGRVKQVYFDKRYTWIGTKENRRLVRKNLYHAQQLKLLEENLFNKIASGEVVPQTFELVPVKTIVSNPVQWAGPIAVQEFFHKPSIAAIKQYLKNVSRKPIFKHLKTSDNKQALICKQFLKDPKNKGITWEILTQTYEEIKSIIDPKSKTYATPDKYFLISDSNFIVLGKNRKGQLRIAIVDV